MGRAERHGREGPWHALEGIGERLVGQLYEAAFADGLGYHCGDEPIESHSSLVKNRLGFSAPVA